MRSRRKGTQEIIEALLRFEEEDIPGISELLVIYTGIPRRTLCGLLKRYQLRDFEHCDRYRVLYTLETGPHAGKWTRGNFVAVWQLSGNSDAAAKLRAQSPRQVLVEAPAR